MMRIAGWVAAVVLVMAGVVRAEGGATTRGAVVEGTRTSTAVSAGKWTYAFRTNESTVLGANAEAIWFGAGSTVWRYNVAEKRIDVVETFLLEGIGLGTLSDGGKFVLTLDRGAAEWERGKWSFLPAPVGFSFVSYAYDAEECLWGFAQKKAYRWNGDAWDIGIRTPNFSEIWRSGNGWLVWNGYTYSSKPGEERCSYATRDFITCLPLNIDEKDYLGRDVWSMGDRTIGPVWNKENKRRLCEFRKDTCTTLVEGELVGIDLKTGAAFTLEMMKGDEGVRVMEDGKKVPAVLPRWPKNKFGHSVLRDAKGDYWYGPHQLVGKEWKMRIPENGVQTTGELFNELDEGRLTFDAARGTWVEKGPAGSRALRLYDQGNRTGWREGKKAEGVKASVWEKVRVKDDGGLELVDAVEFVEDLQQPLCILFRDKEGDTWFSGGAAFYRYDGQSLHRYGNGEVEKQDEMRRAPTMMRAPGGAVWMHGCGQTFAVYDRKADRFVEGEPFEDFAFEIAGRRFSVVGEGIQWRSGFDGMVGVLHEKRGDAWVPLENFLMKERRPRDRATLWLEALYVNGRKGIRGDRILVSGEAGVFEWDVKADRWAFLTPQFGSAFYEETGRKVIIQSHEGLLIHEGDAILTEAAARGKWLKPVKEVLKRMDSADWAEREKAMSEGMALMKGGPREVTRILEDPEIKAGMSAEVNERVGSILKSKAKAEESQLGEEWEVVLARRTGTSLLERMEGRREAKVDYRIRVGMDIDHVKSVCAAAAGGVRTRRGFRQMGEDGSYMGYILANGTMLYVQVENAEGTGKVVKMGLGRVGEGWDKEWDWDDAEKNGLKEVDLRTHSGAERGDGLK